MWRGEVESVGACSKTHQRQNKLETDRYGTIWYVLSR